jgi:hypothetical protein
MQQCTVSQCIYIQARFFHVYERRALRPSVPWLWSRVRCADHVKWRVVIVVVHMCTVYRLERTRTLDTVL